MLYLAITIPYHFQWKRVTRKNIYTGNSIEAKKEEEKGKTLKNTKRRSTHNCPKVTWRNYYKE